MYIKYNVSLSDNQKSKLAKSIIDKSAVVLRLSFSDLSGEDELYLTKTQIGKIQKAKASKKGLDLKISKTQINHVVKKGSGLFSSLMKLGTKLLPMATKLLPGVATGAVSALTDLGLTKMLGGKISNNQSGGFLIPQNKIDKLVEHKNLLTKKQKEQLLSALQTGGNYVIKPTRTQRGGILGSLLSMIGIPLIVKALTGSGGKGRGMSNRTSVVMKPQKIPITPKGKGSGMQNRPYSDMFLPYQTIPYINPDLNLIGKGSKKKRSQRGEGLLLGKNSPLRNIPVLGAIF